MTFIFQYINFIPYLSIIDTRRKSYDCYNNYIIDVKMRKKDRQVYNVTSTYSNKTSRKRVRGSALLRVAQHL